MEICKFAATHLHPASSAVISEDEFYFTDNFGEEYSDYSDESDAPVPYRGKARNVQRDIPTWDPPRKSAMYKGRGHDKDRTFLREDRIRGDIPESDDSYTMVESRKTRQEKSRQQKKEDGDPVEKPLAPPDIGLSIEYKCQSLKAISL